MVVDEQEGEHDISIVELFSPVYEVDKKSLKYYVTLVNATSIELPDEFGQTTIVIDLNEGAGGKFIY